jgi:hypothetical protein
MSVLTPVLTPVWSTVLGFPFQDLTPAKAPMCCFPSERSDGFPSRVSVFHSRMRSHPQHAATPTRSRSNLPGPGDRVTGGGRHSASRQKPSGSLQGDRTRCGELPRRVAIALPTARSVGRPATSYKLALTKTTVALVLGKKTAKLASVACRFRLGMSAGGSHADCF